MSCREGARTIACYDKQAGIAYIEFVVVFIILVFTTLLLLYFALQFLALNLAYDLTTEFVSLSKQANFREAQGEVKLCFHNECQDGRICNCSQSENHQNDDRLCKKACNLVKVKNLISPLFSLSEVILNFAPLNANCANAPNTNPCISTQRVSVTTTFKSFASFLAFVEGNLNSFQLTGEGIVW